MTDNVCTDPRWWERELRRLHEWQARTRELENTVSELRKAVVDLQYRMLQLDGGELHWPGGDRSAAVRRSAPSQSRLVIL